MTRELLEQSMATEIREALQVDILAYGQASLLVSGGSTPLRLFQLLSQESLEWHKVQISLVDERFVEDGHKDQNGTMVRNQLLQNKAADANFYPMVYEAQDADKNLKIAGMKLNELHRPFSMVILGMGTDGHTASLFVDAPEFQQGMDLNNSEELILTHPKKAPYERITFTRRALLNTKRLLLHFYGQEKQAVLSAAKTNKDFNQYPIAGFLNSPQVPLEVKWAE